MSRDYVLWDADLDEDKNYCNLNDLLNVEDDFELTKGISRAKGFPQDAAMKMDSDYPKAMALSDNVVNTCHLVVASKALKEFIEKKKPKNVEFLPVSILNHKKKIASRDYFLIHPVVPQDALDMDKSGPQWSEIAKDNIWDVEQLVLNPKKVDPDALIFRLKHFYSPVFVRRDLAEAIDKENFTGILWLELSEYGE